MLLSVIFVSYNVKDLLHRAISSVFTTYPKGKLQVIVVDNASTDGSAVMVEKEFPRVEIIKSEINNGFSVGNNMARVKAKGDVVLFLNPDTEVQGRAIEKCLEILTNDKTLGAITCKVMLPNGKVDYSCHRGLPSVWNTFCYWTMLAKIFPHSAFFAGYAATYLDINKPHDIECVSGTFLMIKRQVLDQFGWWDEDYWWNGEDIELCYRIKKAGYKIRYEPSETIIHYKGSSSGLWTTGAGHASRETKIRTAKSAAKAMRIFVNKHWQELGPVPIMLIVRLGIYLVEKYRLMKINLGIKYAS